ncbi:hypothetical protein KAFR_0B04160 [Kazachstania africana CBS 2517]|uniref:Calcium-channel protein CCH1 n=1 Tax=Kazachstania africana (strain ATCC 22294 / BCRC 22015 / CBS 2517 / CECT 1963 / NBRC 1671 / NRRL Y-8276) TaxID=1071382 RepID=H2AQR2_KAZAF|nr:hypothetical protein KAFR_0B04160 [Kazachstania africana CBS 2517]CCF56712.1 hypothetical protein KAFR_0B04160 [Kazachstania africana CBS 2517]
MDSDNRKLTAPFEPVRNPFITDDEEPYEDTRNRNVVPPSLHISPPQSEAEDTSESTEEEVEGNRLRLADLFKVRRAEANGGKRPKLSLKTSLSDDDIEDKTSNSIPPARSMLSTPSVGGRRRRSSASTDQSKSRSSSASSKDRVPKSARVLSFVAADDMDDFKILQEGFEGANNEAGQSWLPPLTSNDESKLPKTPADQTSFEGIFLHSKSSQKSTSRERTPEPGPSDYSRLSPLKNASDTKSYLGTKRNDISKEDLHVEQTELINEHISPISVELPDFNVLPGKTSTRPLKLYGNSLGLFPPTSGLRVKFAKIHLHESYRAFYVVLLAFFTVLLAHTTYHPSNINFLYRFHTWSDYVNFTLFIFFTIHDLTKIIAFGFWDDSQMFRATGRKYKTLVERFGIEKLYKSLRAKYGSKIVDSIFPFKVVLHHETDKEYSLRSSVTDIDMLQPKIEYRDMPRAFSRSSWNRIDLMSTICFWIGMFFSIKDYDDKVGIRIFKPLAVFRILRLVNTDTGISSILRALKYGIPQLVNVGWMLVYFWVFFGILGVQIFQGSLRRQCVWINPDDPNDTYQYDMQFCGGYLEPVTGARMNYVFHDGKDGMASKGFLCPQYSKCISNANPYNGRVSFDNIVNSMELVFIVMSANTFTDIMYYTMDSDEMPACLFFIVSIFVLTIWMMNLLIAVLVSSFEMANEKFKKERLEAHSNESWPVRLSVGYWKFFKVKASVTKFPNWAAKGLSVYAKTEWVFVALILADLIFRCVINAESSDDTLKRLFRLDKSISAVLLVESLIRFFLHIPNLWKFLTKPGYIYDLIVSIITLIISTLADKGKLGHIYFWLSVFQISRFYRVVLVIPLTRKLWTMVLKNGVMIWNLTSFYFFFIFLAAIILSVYFEGVVPSSEVSDYPFAMYSLPNSFLSLFTIASTENWTNVLYVLQDYSPNISSAFFCSVLLIMWFILSNSVILNIFIALISDSMDVDENEKRYMQIKHYLKYVYPQKIQDYTHATLLQRIRKKFFRKPNQEDSRDFKQFLMRGTAIMNIAHNMGGDLATEFNDTSGERINAANNWINRIITGLFSLNRLRMFSENPFYKKPEVIFTEINDQNGKSFVLQLNEFEEEKLNYLDKHPSFNYSYYIFSPKHRFRKLCQRLVAPSTGKRTDGRHFYEDDTDAYDKRHYFNRIERDFFVFIYAAVTLLLVVCSCYVTPLYKMKENIETFDWPFYLDITFISMFTLEFIVKTIADGFIYSPNAYVRNPWNCIDLVVLVSMFIYLVAYLENNGNISRIFKGLSALRALRCLTISNTARQTFNLVLFDGIKNICEAALICFSLLFPFAVWGLGLFRGRLSTCNDSDLSKAECFNEFTNTVFNRDIMMPRVYSQPYLHFDSFSKSFKSLYEIISLEGWVDLLSNLMNSTGVGTPASDLATPSNAVFLILFNFLSMVFILNLFVSFIINNHKRTTGSAYHTVEEKSWLESVKLLSQAKQRVRPSLMELPKSRQFFYQLAVEKNNFYYATLLQIVLYIHIVMLLSLSYSETGTSLGYDEKYFMFSTSVFMLQEVFYIYGESLPLYLSQKWNVSRFIFICTSFILTILGLNIPLEYAWFHNVNDFFHLAYFLFIIPQNDTLSELLETAMASLPPILSLTYTWAILFLVYAIALNQIFGLTRLGPNTTDNINFRTVIKSLIVLFRCSFGEGWNYIMDDLTVSKPFCYYGESGYGDCGSNTYAYLLMMSWNVLSMYIFINLFISLVIGNFSYVYRRSTSHFAVNRMEIRKYVNAWSKFDSDGTGEIEFSYLPKLMHSFDGTFSFKIWEGRLSVKNLVKNYMTVNPDDPYDVKVDLEGLNRELDTVDKAKIIQRKLQYRRFVQEVHHTNSYRGAIKFGNLLQLIPLYTSYNPRECLGIDEYVRYLYNLGKVDKFLDNQRNVDVLDMVVTRWKYHLRNKRRDLDEDLIFSQELQVLHNSDSEDSVDIYPLSTPRMDFGVDNFLWSPGLKRDGNNK